MGATTDSSDFRSTTESDTFVSQHPIIGAISLAIVFSAIAGAVAFGYVSALDRLGLNPRGDALVVVGIIADLLLASGVVVLYLRQSAVLEDGLRTLKRQTATHGKENGESDSKLEALQTQTETLQEGIRVLAEQQRIQRALHTPSLGIDRFRITDREESPDTVQFDITNLSAGDAKDLTIQSEVDVIDAPDGYPVSGRKVTCPLTRVNRQHGSGRVPSRAEELSFETDVVVGIFDEANETKRTITCGFSDTMRVFYEDGVEAIGLSLELVYKDTFGDEYTEQIRLARINLTAETTLYDVLQTDSQASPGESTNGWFRKPSMITSSEH